MTLNQQLKHFEVQGYYIYIALPPLSPITLSSHKIKLEFWNTIYLI